jgi:hypothetical protein
MEHKIFKYGLICGKLEEVYNRSGFNTSVFDEGEFMKYIEESPKELFARLMDMNDVINAALDISRPDRLYDEGDEI